MRPWALVLSLVLGLLTVIVVPFPSISRVTARPAYAEDLPSDLKNFCVVCHANASGGPLNTFGHDYLSNGNDVSVIASLDSDGDGYINEVELAQSTFPGDAESFPGAPAEGNFGLLFLLVFGVAFLSLFLYVRTRTSS
jgi:hypothetical protein